VSKERDDAIKAAHTALASIPGYCGCAIALFTNNFTNAQVSKHGVRDDLVDQALASTIDQRHLGRPSIVVPPEYQSRSQRRQHGGG
jgi:hypothetical protein